MRLPIAAAAALLVSATGCATKSKNIDAAYVSPLQYQSYSCDQLTQEAQRVSGHARTLSKEQDDEAQGDAVALGVGLVLFWPALFFMIGDDHEHEIAQLKGEQKAIQQAAVASDCTTLVAAMGQAGLPATTVTASKAAASASTVNAKADTADASSEDQAASAELAAAQNDFDAWYDANEEEFLSELSNQLREEDLNDINTGNNRIDGLKQKQVKSRSESGYIVEVVYIYASSSTWSPTLGREYTETVLVTFANGELTEIDVLS